MRQDEADRPAPETRKIDITPEMIEAGVDALRAEIGSTPEVRSRSPEFDPETVRVVLEAALASRNLQP